MEATALSDELHVTVDVIILVVPSENTPVAANGTLATAKVMKGLDGVTVIETNTGAVTVSVARFEVTPERAALMLVVPVAEAVANPAVATTLLIVATAVSEDFQLTSVVIS